MSSAPVVPPSDADTGLHLSHRVTYYLIRPVVKRLPVRVFAALAMLAAIPFGILQAFRRADHYRRVLECSGRPTTLAARIKLAVLSTYAKVRHLDWYIYEGTPHVQVTWDGPPETERCVYILAHMYGIENIGAWMDRCPSTLVRFTWGNEEQLDLATATPGLKWRAHQAHLRRQHAASHRHLIIGHNPMASRQLYNVADNIIFYQDLHDPQKPDGPLLLGSPVTLRMGALRIAKRTGLPLRYLTLTARGGHWHFHVGPRIEATYDAIAGAIESDIRTRPAQWMLWRDFFDYVDGPISPAEAAAASDASADELPHALTAQPHA